MSELRQKCLKGHVSEISARFCAKNVDCASHRDLKYTAHINFFMISYEEVSNAHQGCIYSITCIINYIKMLIFLYILLNVIYSWDDKAEFSATILSVFIVT